VRGHPPGVRNGLLRRWPAACSEWTCRPACFRPPRRHAPAAVLAAGDAAVLPLRDQVADLTLAAHMLYHVPDPQTAVGELRRVTRRAGRC
jgi:SAM-dependent methyltransferase